jgi:two-component SAPR family response regulator
MGYFNESKNDILTALDMVEDKSQWPANLIGDFYRRLGINYAETSNFNEAERFLEKALEEYKRDFDLGKIADVHNSLAVLNKRRGLLNATLNHLEKARQFWTKLDDIGSVAMVLINLAYVYQRLGSWDESTKLISQAIDDSHSRNYKRIEACALIALAEIQRDQNLIKESLVNFFKGLELSRSIFESYYIAWAKAGLAETYRQMGDLRKAKVLSEEALAEAKYLNQPYEEDQFKLIKARICLDDSQFQQAESILNDTLEAFSRFDDKYAIAINCLLLALSKFLQNQFDAAIDWLRQSLELAKQMECSTYLSLEGDKALFLFEYALSKNVGKNILPTSIKLIKDIRQEIPPTSDKTLINPQGSGKEPHDIEVTAFGKVTVTLPKLSRNVIWASLKSKELFIYLLCHKEGRTKEQIITDLWPDVDYDKASSNFHINLHRARQTVFPTIIVFEKGTYKINQNFTVLFDVWTFEELVNRVKIVSSDREPKQILVTAAEICKNPFLEEIYSDWAEEKRRNLNQLYVKVLSDLSRIDIDNRNYSNAARYLEILTIIEPYQCKYYRDLMLQYRELGDYEAINRTYARYRECSESYANQLTDEVTIFYNHLVSNKAPQ